MMEKTDQDLEIDRGILDQEEVVVPHEIQEDRDVRVVRLVAHMEDSLGQGSPGQVEDRRIRRDQVGRRTADSEIDGEVD